MGRISSRGYRGPHLRSTSSEPRGCGAGTGLLQPSVHGAYGANGDAQRPEHCRQPAAPISIILKPVPKESASATSTSFSMAQDERAPVQAE